MAESVHQTIRDMLHAAGVTFREVHHVVTRTSEESAQARGEPLRVGGKALLLKTDDTFRLFVLSAALRVDFAAIRSQLQVRSVRMARPEELKDRTGLVPGCVPPFGRPVLPFDLYVDPSVQANDRIAFNAGSLTDSIVMSVSDYERIAKPAVFSFAKAD